MPSSNRIRPIIFAFACPVLVLNFAPGAAARAADSQPSWAARPDQAGIVEDRFRIEIDLLGAGLDTNLRVDESPTVPGTTLDAEDDLGLDDSQFLPQVELTLLPGEHHLLRLSALSTHRSADRIIERDIVYDDQIYRVGERVDSRLNLTLVGLTYGFRFLVRQDSELTATFGVQIADVEVNAVVRSRVIREAESGVAPLPLAGLEGRYDFARRWSVEGRIQYLDADIEQVDGSILDARVAVTWRKNPYLLFGLGFRRFAIDADSSDESTPGLVDMSVDGPLLFVRAGL
jgi:hypothetical protein